ncbi:MAG TPA: hypothetical protein VFS97_10465 [Nitrososphaeraceae archaeon]|nr:hypothetical protein [Nitrososphaeraceae archaeon]
MILNQITSLITKCRYQRDVDKQILILNAINFSLPNSLQLKIPSLITNDYVGRALDIIEDRILPLRRTMASSIPMSLRQP